MVNDNLKESETTELKKSTSELKEAIIAIVAILNKHHKGKLYFGVKNDGTVVGQDVAENSLREVSKTISDHVEPKIYPKINKIVLKGKNCILVDFEGSENPYFAYGRAYTRVSDESKQLSAKELENFFIHKNKDKLRWDKEICERATLKDLDNSAINRFISLARDAGRIKIEKNESINMILRKLELFTSKGLTNAAIILFGKKPLHFFINSQLRCGRFKDVAKEEFIDLKDFEGNLFEQLEKAIAFIKNHLELRAKIREFKRVETWEIPLTALRESIINALIHRNYWDNGEVYIKIYDNEVVIANPGKLPEELSISKLYKEHESVPTNPLLANVFYYADFIDRWGRGIINIINALKEEKLPSPKFEESGGYFRIRFKRVKWKGSQKSSQKSSQKIIELIKEKPSTTIEELSNTLAISDRAVKKQLAKLKEEGIIKRVGPDKGGYWEVN
ncbi:putative DNA binding domain-containing protein [Candidatus Woesearchaeota archaeon]|nr:putative DNA binding domain-containing protein [Candidatus Woesearchaeota archaeon]